MKKLKKDMKNYIGGGLMLGVGNVALGALGQGGMLSGASKMYGVAGSAMIGSNIMGYVNKKTKVKK